MANLKKEYNLRESDIDPFKGTNLDDEAKNKNTSEGEYATYKNTTYNFDNQQKKWTPNKNAKGGDYHTSGIRTDMDKTVNIKIYQSEGLGTSINSNVFDVHSQRNSNAVQVKPIEYTPNDNVEKEELNIGNTAGYAEGYQGGFDSRMDLVTTSDNQMTYRDYKSKDTDVFTDMSGGIANESVQSEAATKTNIGGVIIEAGNHFNRGNDFTAAEAAKTNDDGSKTKAKADRNSSMVLDRSMFLNNQNSDILALRGGSGIEIKTDGAIGYK
jgi:hypothetical protein